MGRKYIPTTAANGEIVYTKKNDFKAAAKEIMNRGKDVPSMVQSITSDLKDAVEYRKTISRQALDHRMPAEKGVQYKGRMEDLNKIQKEINMLVNKLKRYGVRVNKQALAHDKVVYEGGHLTMFTTEDLKRMKLDIFEENVANKISDDLRDYMLIVIESTMDQVVRTQTYLEKVEEVINGQREHFVAFVTESHNEGLISALQKEVLLEMAEDDFMFEAPTPDKLPELVQSFLEAAEAGDEDKKAAIKEQIDVAKSLKEIEGGSTDKAPVDNKEGAVTEGAKEECSIVEKLEALKVKLSDEERAIAEKFDELIANGGEEPVKEEQKEEDTKEDDPKTEEPKEEPKEEEPVKESTEEPVVEEPVTEEPTTVVESEVQPLENSVVVESTIESSLSKEEGDSLLAYVKESVADGVYSEEDAARIEKMLKL